MQNKRSRYAPLLGLCALVLFFAWQAKTAGYSGAPGKVTVSTGSKLWSDGQKMEVRSAGSVSRALLWLAVFFPGALGLQQERRRQGGSPPPRPRHLAVRHLYRFLRPPPFYARLFLACF
jgi:hypothetical protein